MRLQKSVTILQCYVAYISSAPGPELFRSCAVAEPTALFKLNLQPCIATCLGPEAPRNTTTKVGSLTKSPCRKHAGKEAISYVSSTATVPVFILSNVAVHYGLTRTLQPGDAAPTTRLPVEWV